jgi:hypothetical protein
VRKNTLAVFFLAICPLLVAQQPVPKPDAPVEHKLGPTSSAAVPAKPNTLVDGTPVKLRIGRNVSSADAKVGEHVDFEVLEEVQVMGVVVIPKGAVASATVTDAQAKRRLGRAGKLYLTLDFVRLADNEKAALSANAGGSGGSHTGAMVGAMAATALFTLGGSALFLLMHGKDITIPKGTETTAYVNGDLPLDMAKFGVVSQEPPASPSSALFTQASLSIESTPIGADIEIDGAFVGSTPSTISIPMGNHEIVLKKKGFSAWSRKMNSTGGAVHIAAELESAPGQ